MAMLRIPPYTRISDDLRLTANHLPKGHQSHAKRRPFGRQKTAFCNILDYSGLQASHGTCRKTLCNALPETIFSLSLFHNINTDSIMEEDNKQDKNQQAAGSYLAIGICFGVAFGIIFDNLAVWMCLGVGIGLLAPSFLKNRNNDGDKA